MEKGKQTSTPLNLLPGDITSTEQYGALELGSYCKSQQDDGNREDRFAVTLTKGDMTIGHVPREQSRILWHFLTHSGTLTAEVTGRCRQ